MTAKELYQTLICAYSDRNWEVVVLTPGAGVHGSNAKCDYSHVHRVILGNSPMRVTLRLRRFEQKSAGGELGTMDIFSKLHELSSNEGFDTAEIGIESDAWDWRFGKPGLNGVEFIPFLGSKALCLVPEGVRRARR